MTIEYRIPYNLWQFVYMVMIKTDWLLRSLTLTLLVSFAISVYVLAPPVYGQGGNNPAPLPTNIKEYNSTFGELTGKYWQWLLSTPKETNPAGDATGKYCAVNQGGPVWFLAGTFGGSAQRTCTIPAGKAILLSPLAAECSFTEYPKLKTETDLRNCAKPLADAITDMVVNVDGVNVQNLQQYRVQSPMFNVSFPDNNVYGVTSGPTQSVSDGYFVLLPPLSRGTHDVRFSAAVIGLTTTNIPTTNFATDAAYRITVK